MARTLGFLTLVATLSAGPFGSTLTPDQAAFIAEGEARFAAAGLDLPQIEYVFHDDTEACDWHRGLYYPSTGTLMICTMSQEALVHELAHAWAESTLSATDKTAFVARRDLPTWDDHRLVWELRGTEHVAEIIAWGVADESRLVTWVEDDGEVTHRLLTIADSDPAVLRDEYRRLTGSDPVVRDPAEWDATEGVVAFSPEAARAQP